MTKPTFQETLDEIHQDMLAAKRNPDFEGAHGDADDLLTRLVALLAAPRDAQTQRSARLTLRAYNQVTKYYA